MASSQLVLEARVRRWRALDQPWIFAVLVIWGTKDLFVELWLFVLLLAAMLVLIARHRWRPGVLGATREGLTLDGKPLAPWSRVTAVVQAGESDLLIRYRRYGLIQNIGCELEDAASARRIEELAASRVRRQEIDLASFRVAVLFGLLTLAVVASLEYPAMATALFVLFALPLVLVRRPVAVFGADGVLVRGYLSRRFARGDRIADCPALSAELLRVELSGQPPLSLRLPLYASRFGPAYASSLRRRVLALRGATPELSEAQRGALRRGARSTGEWLTALREAARVAHRDPLPRALLWQVVEAPGSEEERAAALAALGPGLDGDERERVAALGRGLVSQRVRRAVDAVLAGDDRQLERALGVASAAPP